MNSRTVLERVLVITRRQTDGDALEQSLRQMCPECQILQARDVQGGFDLLVREKADVLFMEFSAAGREGSKMEEMKKRNLYVPVIAMIEKGRERDAAEAIKEGAYDYLMKGDDYRDALPRVIERLQRISVLIQEREDDLEQQSILFRQIYRSQKWWQNIIDAITDYLFVIDEKGCILRTNKAFSDLFGKEPADIIMSPYYSLFGLNEPHEWCVLPEGKEVFAARSVERRLGETDYLISCYPIFYDEREAAVYILKDITETRRLKDQVYHLDKLSSLGTLTSGVAHEINNPLTGIIGYTEMLLMKDEEGTNKKYLQKIYDSAIRCKRIVENMLTFARQTPAQKSVEKINDIIDKTIELHEYWLKSTNIEIIKEYGETPSVSVDNQQIQQVILNLLINAEHAIVETGRRGRIAFRTAYDASANLTSIEVVDNGNGIPQDVLPKIFDPFFTTKPVNKGTGLGLSIAHGIIAEQGGTIEALSTPGEGTTFTIKIPTNNTLP